MTGERAVRSFLYDNLTSHFPRAALFGQLENWLDEITNYFVIRQTSGFVKGFKNKFKVLK
jgi:transposase